MKAAPMDRNRQLVRVLRLWKDLDGASAVPAIAKLAARYGVSKRTIRRDLRALEAAGARLPAHRYNPQTEAIEPRGVALVKYIRVEKLHDSPSGKTQVFAVRTKDGFRSEHLGVIKWHSPWRAYAFFPNVGTLYEPVCLRDLATFCEHETRARREAARMPRSTSNTEVRATQ